MKDSTLAGNVTLEGNGGGEGCGIDKSDGSGGGLFDASGGGFGGGEGERVLTRSLRLSYVKGAISAASAFALAAALHTPPAPLA